MYFVSIELQANYICFQGGVYCPRKQKQKQKQKQKPQNQKPQEQKQKPQWQDKPIVSKAIRKAAKMESGMIKEHAYNNPNQKVYTWEGNISCFKPKLAAFKIFKLPSRG